MGASLLVTRKPAQAAFKRSPGDDAFLTGFEGTFKSPAFLFARCIHRVPGLRPPPRAGEGETRVRKPGRGCTTGQGAPGAKDPWMRNPCGRGESAGGLRREKAEDPRKGEGDRSQWHLSVFPAHVSGTIALALFTAK